MNRQLTLIGSLRRFFLFALVFLAGAAAATFESKLYGAGDWSWLVPDGAAYAAVEHEGVVYIGGSFTGMAPYTGGLAASDFDTGAPLAAWPRVEGRVDAIVSDGDGGWFIGGSFHRVGVFVRDNLVHIRPDGSVNPEWNPSPSATVSALAFIDGTLYASGFFNRIAGKERSRLAALDAVSGEATGFRADTESVSALVVHDDILILGGSFSSVGGVSQRGLAAVNRITGDVLSGFPATNGPVNALAVRDGTVYVGGSFSQVEEKERGHLAAVKIETGELLDWSPNARTPGMSGIHALAVDGARILIGGRFPTIEGVNQRHLAAVDAISGAVLDWLPLIDGYSPKIYAIDVDGERIYIGGDEFDSVNGEPRENIAVLHRTMGETLEWETRANGGSVEAVATAAGHVIFGGRFNSTGVLVPRNHLAAYDTQTGQLTEWDPGADWPVSELVLVGDRLFAGGAFTEIAGDQRRGIAAFDLASGNLTSWQPEIGGPVYSLYFMANRLFAGGRFTRADGTSAGALMSFDPESGASTGWSPQVEDDSGGTPAVSTITGADGAIYISGRFSEVGGEPRRGFAAIDADTGATFPWSADADWPSFSRIKALEIVSNHLYIGGSFVYLAGERRPFLGAVERSSGILTDFVMPELTSGSGVSALHSLESILYIGGSWNWNGKQRSLLAMNLDSEVIEWDLPIYSLPQVIRTAGDLLLVGGGFRRFGALRDGNWLPLEAPAPPVRLAASPAGSDGIVLVWQRNSDNETATTVERRDAENETAAWITVGTTEKGGTAFTDETVQPGQDYEYRVFTFNGAGESERSNVAETRAPLNFNQWMDSLPAEQLPPADLRGPLDEPRGDGVTNLIKFALGAPPMADVSERLPRSVLISGQDEPQTKFGVEVIRSRRAAGIEWHLRASEDLFKWQSVSADLTVVEELDGDLDLQRVRLTESVFPEDVFKRFYRVEINLAD